LVTKHNAKDTSLIKTRSLPTRLRFDFRQPDSKSLTLFIYTTCLTLTVDHIFVYIKESKKISILVFIDGFVHTIAIGEYERKVNDSHLKIYLIYLELGELITNDFTGKKKSFLEKQNKFVYLVRVSSTNRGQIEIDLKKQVDQMWKSIGKFAANHLSVCPMQDFGMCKKRFRN
jgi:hypothetical protein